MAFKLRFTTEAKKQLEALESDPKKLNRVRRCLGFLELNPQHPGLHSHKYSQMKTLTNVDIWESYVENKSPAAWRVFWHDGPGKSEITVFTITPHP